MTSTASDVTTANPGPAHPGHTTAGEARPQDVR